MSVIIEGIEQNSVADDYGFEAGDTLFAINGHEINDVLDYGFYQNDEELTVTVIDKCGKRIDVFVEKDEYEELGLIFGSYLMDKKHSCKNKCIFCFIDQLPKNLRSSLYFKDDDSRLSFLFGNYITLTNLNDDDIDRIISMHISPINVSVHTTNPELRVRMMRNKNAGESLKLLYKLNSGGIKLNSQLVLCPGYNDGDELERTLSDLTKLQNMECIAAVPVGLTKYRNGLECLKGFDKSSAAAAIDTIDKYGELCIKKYGQRRVYASDEFYILAEREIPDAAFYGDFLQLENGVGLWALLKSQAYEALAETEAAAFDNRTVSVATGVAAEPLLKEIADRIEDKFKGIKINVFKIENNFFGEKITVAGLVTATDITEQLSGKKLGEKLLIPSSMLRSEGDMFLDGVTVAELSKKLGVKVAVTEFDGYELIEGILKEENGGV